MTVGFTGTRRGVTEAQVDSLRLELVRLSLIEDVLTHGDCSGADRMADTIWDSLGGRVVHRPGDQEQLRWALTHARPHDTVTQVRPYLERNELIAVSRVVVAVPHETVEVVRSGTWATVRAARRHGSTVLLVLPSGQVVREPGQLALL